MKYNEKNLPIVCMMTNSTCYKGTSEMEIKGVLWHSTGVNNPTIKRFVQPSENDPNYDNLINKIGKNRYNNDWNHISRTAGLNCWIGQLADSTVATVQTLPWNYRPWGCGKGSKGSCNDGWIQFEICEDSLTNKAYFDKVYEEACEITAYLCKKYNLDPKGTVMHNGVKVPVILCHADSHKLGLGTNHGDVLHWFKKYNKTMDDVRNDVYNLINGKPAAPEATEIYRVRKEWNQPNTQIGAYRQLGNAIIACNNAGTGYKVFDSVGKVIYPSTPAPTPTPTPVKPEKNLVLEWQKAAIADGYKFPKYGADGKWGAESAAVAKKAICKKQVIGYKNKNLTKFIQEQLGINADGLFGNNTRNAVIAFQKKNNLTADGIVGYNTWVKMLGV